MPTHTSSLVKQELALPHNKAVTMERRKMQQRNAPFNNSLEVRRGKNKSMDILVLNEKNEDPASSYNTITAGMKTLTIKREPSQAKTIHSRGQHKSLLES